LSGALQCAEVQQFGIEIRLKLGHVRRMETSPRQLTRNRIKVGLIALAIYGFGNFGPGIGIFFDSGRHGDHFEDRIDRLTAETERAAEFAERAALLAEEAAREAEARADRADF